MPNESNIYIVMVHLLLLGRTMLRVSGTRFTTCKLLLVFFILSLGCDNKQALAPAPVNDEPTLQKLADAYTQLRQDLPVSPAGLNPQGKRKFVEQVFTTAGFSYHKTLIAAANTPEKKRSQYFNDLKQLLLMPGTGLNKRDLLQIYSQEEIEAIERM